ncbi:alpha/beta fold hydrolase [Halobaculum lipolyticum]|uniref:Alpha/beta fold hydrolase n=1 Tax=Halobaculum lipolyticum TaxID=3032001 RepID=A0ABD5WDF3_9EURY|nr:alpha/beta fold hydrolase [Halobaculum sp. DT31]
MAERRGAGARLRANAERLAVWLLVAALVVTAPVGFYLATPATATPGTVDAVRADERIEVSRSDGVYALEPADGDPVAGLVFYPGGHVTADAYLATLAPLAARADVAVYVVEMPLQFAVLDPDAADRVIDAHLGIERWFVGGHSLGGAMACRYASTAPDRLEGLVLFAAYCEADRSPEVATLSVVGSADGVLDRDTYRERLAVLPPDATLVGIEGMNHSQFGAYGGQPGDDPARIGDAEARERLADAVVGWVTDRLAHS